MVLEEKIKRAYIKFDVPADRIVTDQTMLRLFSQKVGEADTDLVERTLIRLRKRGQDRGGLARLRR